MGIVIIRNNQTEMLLMWPITADTMFCEPPQMVSDTKLHAFVGTMYPVADLGGP